MSGVADPSYRCRLQPIPAPLEGGVGVGFSFFQPPCSNASQLASRRMGQPCGGTFGRITAPEGAVGRRGTGALELGVGSLTAWALEPAADLFKLDG